jgi:hypothetical protein
LEPGDQEDESLYPRAGISVGWAPMGQTIEPAARLIFTEDQPEQ